jgi:hypothetical protein
MVPLFQGLLSQPFPTINTIDHFGSFKSDIKIAALDSKVETSVFILDEVKCNLSGGGW